MIDRNLEKELINTGLYRFYKCAMENLNQAAAESEKGAKTETDYEHVGDFLLGVYKMCMKENE